MNARAEFDLEGTYAALWHAERAAYIAAGASRLPRTGKGERLNHGLPVGREYPIIARHMRKGNTLTISEAAALADLTLTQAKRALQYLRDRGFCEGDGKVGRQMINRWVAK